MHIIIKDLVTAGKRIDNSLLRILQVILSILRPLLEYGSKVWRCIMSQSKTLDAVLLATCKKILYCSPKICSEAVDLGIEHLRNKKSSFVF